MNNKITMKVPLVEIDGDEMTRVIWEMLKEMLLEPYIELKTEYYDLGLKKEMKPMIILLLRRLMQLKGMV